MKRKQKLNCYRTFAVHDSKIDKENSVFGIGEFRNYIDTSKAKVIAQLKRNGYNRIVMVERL